MISSRTLPKTIYSGAYETSHCQGIAIDAERRYMYYSFTQQLVKTDLEGNLIGTCGGLTGHLGCIAYNYDDGKVYGSLEYKSKLSFYVAIFDVDKIDRPNMDAEKDGVMKTVWLPDVVEDFTATLDDSKFAFQGDVNKNKTDHRYGCSGIDGTSFGPAFGAPKDSPKQLMITYGIYRNDERTDNDYQILVQYDWRKFGAYAKPLNQETHHTSGVRADEKYFVFTGNTTYGVQNLEYDSVSGNWLMCVYRGAKPQFPNRYLYIIDGSKPAVKTAIWGQASPEIHPVLQLWEAGIYDKKSGVWGWDFPRGSTGIICLGDGYWYAGHEGHTDKGSDTTVHLYKWTGVPPLGFEEVE